MARNCSGAALAAGLGSLAVVTVGKAAPETRERTSRENFSQVQTEYRQGIQGVSNLEVLVAQNQYLSAQLELERARLQSKLDWFQLENAQGRIPVR